MLKNMRTRSNPELAMAFEAGFSNAASSLSKLVNDSIIFNTIDSGFQSSANTIVYGSEFDCENAPSGVLLTTEVFGEVLGKSYLLLSQKDVDLIARQIPRNSKAGLKDEFLKEVDNILSAAVISKLADALNIRMYGDVPFLVVGKRASLKDIIADEFGEQSSEVYVSSMYFSFEKHPAVRMLFVWVFDAVILKREFVRV